MLRWVLLALAFSLAACTSMEAGPGADSGNVRDTSRQGRTVPEGALVLFPKEVEPGELPAGWEKWVIHPLKRKTDYGFKRDKGGVYLEARSRSSASGLIYRLDVDPAAFDTLEFSWMVDNLLEGADAAERESEDSPVRVVLAFDGDKSTLPAREKAFFERVKLFTRQDMPYATLMYIWDNARPLDTLIANPHTSRVQKLVASTGPGGLKTWQLHRRNVVEDYRKAYGKAPGRLIGVAIMTDTDNTGTMTQARYRDLMLYKSRAGAQ